MKRHAAILVCAISTGYFMGPSGALLAFIGSLLIATERHEA